MKFTSRLIRIENGLGFFQVAQDRKQAYEKLVKAYYPDGTRPEEQPPKNLDEAYRRLDDLWNGQKSHIRKLL